MYFRQQFKKKNTVNIILFLRLCNNLESIGPPHPYPNPKCLECNTQICKRMKIVLQTRKDVGKRIKHGLCERNANQVDGKRK